MTNRQLLNFIDISFPGTFFLLKLCFTNGKIAFYEQQIEKTDKGQASSLIGLSDIL